MKSLRIILLVAALLATSVSAIRVATWIDWDAWMRNRYPLK